MSVVKLMGGLGNQLFQYAFGQIVQRRKGTPVSYSTEWYIRHKIASRPYVLDKFGMNITTVPNSGGHVVVERVEDITRVLFAYPDNVNVTYHGYWQHPSWYDEYLLEKFRHEFHIRNEYLTKAFHDWRSIVDREHNPIALHVRRGDYVGHQNHLALPFQYYVNALEYMAAMKEDPSVFIFSDDLEWCVDHFDGCHFVDLPDYLCFELMRNCKHFIISNSTFSWWPAYLSYNATVIAPNQWSRDRRDVAIHHERRMLLGDWTKISLS